MKNKPRLNRVLLEYAPFVFFLVFCGESLVMKLNSGRFWLKTGIFSLLALTLSSALYVAAVYALFDAKAAQVAIEQALAAQQRQITLASAPRPLFFPLGVHVEALNISQAQQHEAFAKLKQLKIGLNIPSLLFDQKTVIRSIDADAIELKTVQLDDGSFDFADLFKAQTASSLALDKIRFRNVTVQVFDAQHAPKFSFEHGFFKIKDLQDEAQLELDGILKQGQQALTMKLKTPLRVTEKALWIDQMRLQLDGELFNMRGVRLEASGSANVQWSDGKLSARHLQTEIIATEPLLHLNASLPTLTVEQGRLQSPKVQLDGSVTHPGARYNFSGQLHSVALRPETGRVQRIEGQVQWFFGQQKLDMLIDTPLHYHSLQDLRLAPLRLSTQLISPQLPRREMLATLIGEMRADLQQDLILTQLDGTLDGEKLRIKSQQQGLLAAPKHTLALALSRLDLNRYLPRATQKAQEAPLLNSEIPLGLNWLKGLDLEGDVEIGELSVGRFAMHNVDFHVSARPEKLEFSPMSADIYEGQLSGSFHMLSGDKPTIFLDQRLNRMNLQPLLKDVFNFDRVHGIGNGRVQINAHGASLSEMKQTLNGTLALNLNQGELLGIDLVAALNNLGGELQNWTLQRPLQSSADQKTRFQHLNASFHFENGIARNQDLMLNSSVLNLTGGGKVDLVQNIIDYTLEARVNPSAITTVKNLSVPLKITGSLAAPTYALDFNRLVGEKKTNDERQNALKEQITQPLKALVPLRPSDKAPDKAAAP